MSLALLRSLSLMLVALGCGSWLASGIRAESGVEESGVEESGVEESVVEESVVEESVVEESAVRETPADPNAAVELRLYPGEINLTNGVDAQSVVVQAVLASGLTRDVTDEVSWKLDSQGVVDRDGTRLTPAGDGQTVLHAQLGELAAAAPVSVTGATEIPPVSFKLDVMPVFMKSGCNSGSCHGAARGKDGFRLSLFGFDPDGDYYRLTREMSGRRVDLSLPEDCLLVNKATGTVSHTGGQLMQPGDEYYQTLVNWLESGALNDPGEVPTVDRLEVMPEAAVLNGPGETQQLTVRATYSDGSDRDVTSLAYFMTSNENSVAIDQSGQLTGGNRGEAFVMARFDTHTVGIPVVTLPRDLEFQWPEIPENNYIDTHIHNKLKKLRITPSELCSDREFIRRATLDICGLLPEPARVEAFVNDSAPDKRDQLVDELLARPEFVDIWVMKWAELLQVRSSNLVSYKATLLYYDWLQAQISANVPINEMIVSLLAAEGGTFTSPATNYYENERDLLKVTENVAQVFLGMRLQCAQCHNHPFDRWTMDDYYGFAAFFTQIGRKASGNDPRERVVFNQGGGEVRHPVTGQNAVPRFLGGEQPDTAGQDRRQLVARWITAPENPWFSRNLANLVWAHFMGRGIVHEVDDVRVSNPPSNQELLDALGTNFADYGYDFKRLVRDICTSRTYQLQTTPNESNASDKSNFSHANLRRIRAEVLLDVISQVTETRNKFRGLPLGARAVSIADGNTSNYFLSTFGRASRQTVCSCEVRVDPNLSQALHLINGETVQNKVAQGGVVERLQAEGKSETEIIGDLYLRCLSRLPNETETAQIAAFMQDLPPLAAAEAAARLVLERQSAVEMATGNLNTAQAAMEQANQAATTARAAVAAPARAVAEAEARLATATEAVKPAKAALAAANQDLETAQANPETPEARLAELQAAADTANQALTDATTAMEQAGQAVAAACTARDAPAQALAEAETAATQADQKRKTAGAALETANQSLTAAREAAEATEDSIAAAQATVTTATSVVAEAEAGLQAANARLGQAQAAVDAPAAAVASAEAAVATANTRLGESQAVLDTANQQLSEAKTAAEAANQAVAEARRIALRDVFWALLNSQEFIFNH